MIQVGQLQERLLLNMQERASILFQLGIMHLRGMRRKQGLAQEASEHFLDHSSELSEISTIHSNALIER